MSDYNLETKCIHSGYTPSKGEPCALPVYQSTTYKYDTTDEMGQLFDLKADGYFYTRLQNPTNDAVAAKIADLEGGVAAILTSSGQAANFYAVFNICEIVKIMTDGFFPYENETATNLKTAADFKKIKPLADDDKWFTQQIDYAKRLTACLLYTSRCV